MEQQFRQILSDSLPSTCGVASGYFYDAASNCSPEVDVMLYQDEEAFRLDPIPQDQHYVPYTSVSIMGQLKNSAGSLSDALKQVRGNKNAWNSMRATAQSLGITGQPVQFEPLTFVICGTSSDKEIAELDVTLRTAGYPYPDYILLLDRGLIVAGQFDLIAYDAPMIHFVEYRNANSMHLCQPDGAKESLNGIALLWLYFALVSKLNLDKGNNLRYHAFSQQIERLYPLRPIKKLV